LYHDFYKALPTSDLPGISDAAVAEDGGDNDNAADSFPDETSASTDELAASDIMSLSTSHDTSSRTTRSSGRIRARCNVDNASALKS